jgi:DNA-3-methyladenine glycosylase I
LSSDALGPQGVPAPGIFRCPWCGDDPLYQVYHDTEWGVPVHDDRRHFEFLILEGAQAGLSWLTILRKREGYRRAYRGFDPEAVARFAPEDVERLVADSGIVRNRLKITSSITNARLFLEIQEEFGSFDRYFWRFVGEKPIRNAWETMGDVPATTPESDAVARDLKKRGFKFAGSTIMYAHMQACGLVNDHLVDCFRHSQVGEPTGP